MRRLAVSLAGFRRGCCDRGVALLKVFDHVQAAIRRTLTRLGGRLFVAATGSGWSRFTPVPELSAKTDRPFPIAMLYPTGSPTTATSNILASPDRSGRLRLDVRPISHNGHEHGLPTAAVLEMSAAYVNRASGAR